MAESKSTSILIELSSDDTFEGGFIVLERDSDYEEEMGTLNGEAYFKVYYAGGSYTIEWSSDANVNKVATNIPSEITTRITFTKSDSATLSIPKAGGTSVSWDWIGKDRGQVVVTNDVVQLSSEVVGLLDLTYTAYADRWRVTNMEEDLLVVGSLLDNISSLTINYDEETPEHQDFLVKDKCSGLPVAGVTVSITGPLGYLKAGVTNVNGILPLGILRSGEYQVHMVKAGYFDSEDDILANDSFTISY